MKSLLMAAILICFASSSFAIVDPTVDTIGIFFDVDADTYVYHSMVPHESVTAYLLIVMPSDVAGVSGWECDVEILGTTLAPTWTLAAGLDVDGLPNRFQVGIGIAPDALPAAPTVMLATWTALIPNPTDVVEMRVQAVPGSTSFADSPGYASGADAGTLIPLGINEPCPGWPVTAINEDCPVGNEEVSWSGMKTLFR